MGKSSPKVLPWPAGTPKALLAQTAPHVLSSTGGIVFLASTKTAFHHGVPGVWRMLLHQEASLEETF